MSRDELITLFFFNPFTRQKIELPAASYSFISVCFTNPPTSPDCTVFGIFECNDGTRFGRLKIKDKEWKSELFESIDGHSWNSAFPPLYFNGVYFCLAYGSRDICVFDPTDDNDWQWMHYNVYVNSGSSSEEDEEEEEDDDKEGEEEEESSEKDEVDDKEGEEEEESSEKDEEDDTEGEEEEEGIEKDEEDDKEGEEEESSEKEVEVVHENYLAEVDGDIWGVFVTGDERRVTVKKLDSTEMRWLEPETLGNKCLYVSPSGSFAETCTDGTANTIYFNKFHKGSGVVYSLKSGMYHSLLSDFASEEAYGLTEVDFGAWVIPTNQEILD